MDVPYQPEAFYDIPVPYAVFQLIFDPTHKKVVNTVYLFVNDEYCRLAGCEKEDLLNHRFLDVYPEGDRWMRYCQWAFERKEAVRKADRHMYQDKKAYYLRTGIERRKLHEGL